MGITSGSIIVYIKRDTRSLDYGSNRPHGTYHVGFCLWSERVSMGAGGALASPTTVSLVVSREGRYC